MLPEQHVANGQGPVLPLDDAHLLRILLPSSPLSRLKLVSPSVLHLRCSTAVDREANRHFLRGGGESDPRSTAKPDDICCEAAASPTKRAQGGLELGSESAPFDKVAAKSMAISACGNGFRDG